MEEDGEETRKREKPETRQGRKMGDRVGRSGKNKPVDYAI